jgi:hypothetical protein
MPTTAVGRGDGTCGNLDGHADLATALFGENERDDGIAADLRKAGALQRFRLDGKHGDSMAGGWRRADRP